MSKILGIDLGTTNSAASCVINGVAEIIENKEGSRTTPSIVALSKNGERLVGILAKRQSVTNPKNTIFSVKRLIGRRFDDKEVQEDIKMFPFELRKSSSGGVEIKLGEEWKKPEEISAMVLQKIKMDAEEKLGEKIDEAIITVPAYFDDSQRQATKNAGEIAGFKVKRIINEPTAAALTYGLNKRKDERVVVYDFGGGTFDISVLEISEDTVEVKVTGGNMKLGGDDFDNKIIEYLISEFKKKEGIDLSKDSLALQRLRESSERAKHELSTMMEAEINLPFITSDSSGPKHFEIKLTRAKLEEITKDLIDTSIKLIEETLKEKNFSKSDINEIILIGGQTRMPAIQKAVKEFFGKEPNKEINPDEVVAMGAALQGGVIQGDVKDVLLLDVTPLSLGIETLGGVFTKLIEKNTTIPASKSQVFSTAVDNQTQVEIHVLQGERQMASDNKTLAKFVLDGLPPAPRGIPQVEVIFDIDVNGILNVSAKDKATGKEQSVKIEASTGLSKEEIEKMKKDAELHKQEDEKKKQSIDSKNQAEQIIYLAEKTIKEAGDKISSDERQEIENKVNDVKDSLKTEDGERIKKEAEELSQIVSKIGAKMYQAQQGQTGQTGAQETEQTGQEGEKTEDKTGENENKKDEGDSQDVEFKEKE
jgi:molecular chaperone DnaK